MQEGVCESRNGRAKLAVIHTRPHIRWPRLIYAPLDSSITP